MAALPLTLSHSATAKSELSHIPNQKETDWSEICHGKYFMAKIKALKCHKPETIPF
jgi:hypothetical protein